MLIIKVLQTDSLSGKQISSFFGDQVRKTPDFLLNYFRCVWITSFHVWEDMTLRMLSQICQKTKLLARKSVLLNALAMAF